VTETIHSTREIEALIPHRWPFLLVDRIVEYDAEAKRIVGIKGVSATEWFFQGHFPGLPVMPGVHPRMASELRGPTVARQLEPPGFLALNYGARTPISVLIAHLAFGAILGGFYRPPRPVDARCGVSVHAAPAAVELLCHAFQVLLHELLYVPLVATL